MCELVRIKRVINYTYTHRQRSPIERRSKKKKKDLKSPDRESRDVPEGVNWLYKLSITEFVIITRCTYSFIPRDYTYLKFLFFAKKILIYHFLLVYIYIYIKNFNFN